ncbi:MAG: carboxypeptidase-like regulatory domain-containing protein [bacterium]|nr:carboxypeptidase-like regulatory domain-containing protein [bacterium]
MKNAWLGALVVALVIVVWCCWPPAASLPVPVESAGAAAPLSDFGPTVDDFGDGRRSDVPAPELQREAVSDAAVAAADQGARVVTIWQGEGEPAVGIPIDVYRVESRSFRRRVARGVTGVDGVLGLADLEPAEYVFRTGRVYERAAVVADRLTEVRLEIPVGPTVTGTVVDDHDAPLAGASVCALINYGRSDVATTDATGRFRVRLAKNSRLWATSSGFEPSPMQKVTRDTNDLVIRLVPAGGSVRGVVVDPDGRPVPGAEVRVGLDLAIDQRAKRPPVHLQADSRGEFVTDEVPRDKLRVYAVAADFAFGVTDAYGSASDPVVVKLRRAASVHGVALGGENGDEPVADLAIMVHRQRDQPGLLQACSDRLTRFETRTDEVGRYRVRGIPPGRVWVVAMAQKSTEAVYLNVLLRAGDEHEWNPDMAVPPGKIRGRLVGPGGAPLTGWKVAASRVDLVAMRAEGQEATTDDEGRFEVSRLRPKPHALTAKSPESSAVIAKRVAVMPGPSEFVWRMPGLPEQSGTFRGVVLGPDGEPVTAAKYRAKANGVTRSGAADAAGAFEIDRVLPGTWQLTGRLKGYGSFGLGEHRVMPNAVLDLGTHRLPARGRVDVRVVAGKLDPADVALGLEQLAGGDNKSREFEVTATGWRSPELPPGRYRLTVRGTNFAWVAREIVIPAGDAAEVDVTVAPVAPVAIEFVPQHLEGTAWHDGVSVKIFDASGGLLLKKTQMVAGTPTATFTIGLAPGAYSVVATSPNTAYRRGEASFVVPAAGTEQLAVRVLLEVLRD